MTEIQAEEEKRRLHEAVMAEQARAIMEHQNRIAAEQARAQAASAAWGSSKNTGKLSLREIQELELKQAGMCSRFKFQCISWSCVDAFVLSIVDFLACVCFHSRATQTCC